MTIATANKRNTKKPAKVKPPQQDAPDARNRNSGTPQQRMLRKLKESDLDEKDAKQMGLVPFTAQQAANLDLPDGKTTDGFQIPYFSPAGKRTEGFRYRNFETVLKTAHSNGFLGGRTTEKEIPKYLQPNGTEPEVYFPPVGNFMWEEMVEDSKYELYLTEGELKAACACKKGYPCLGLGGVWSFMSNARGQRLIPALMDIVWRERNVCIVYDSDTSIKLDVALAESRFARELSNKGAKVRAVRLPTLPGMTKTGLDDFLARPNGGAEFDELLKQTGLFSELEEMYKLNTEMVYVKNPSMGMVLPKNDHPPDQRRFRAQKLSVLTNEVYADRKIRVVGSDGNPKELPAAKEWVKWAGRAVVDSVTYAPGKGPILNGNQLNMWEGWGCEPVEGGVTPFLMLLDALSEGLSDDHKKWLLQWLAYPIQHPGIDGKLNTAIVLWGTTGTGKTALAYTMKEVYGRTNFSEVTRAELMSDFTEWREDKQYLLGEEITGSSPKDVRNLADILKPLITGAETLINQKGVARYPIPNRFNIQFNSNHPDCMDVADDDRRLFIHEGDTPRRESRGVVHAG